MDLEGFTPCRFPKFLNKQFALQPVLGSYNNIPNSKKMNSVSPMKVIITGSTGMVGKSVLLECLKSPMVGKVLIINRQSLGMNHEKLSEIILPDFMQVGSIAEQLQGFDACFHCMGVSAAGMKEADYRKITYDMTIKLADTMLAQNPGMVFCYVSGAGTDSSEQGRMMWARVKGKTENDLLNMGFRDAYMFRPAYIHPSKGIRARNKYYNLFYFFLKPLYPLFKRATKYVTNSETIGKAMILSAVKGYEKKVLENRDINLIAEKYTEAN